MKKSVKAEHALKHKGKKAPRPSKNMELDPSKAPKHRPSMHPGEPAGPYKMPKGGEQSMSPDSRKKGLPKKTAAEGVKGPNEGDKLYLKPEGNKDRY